MELPTAREVADFIFKVVDENGDGELQLSELKDYIQSLLPHLTITEEDIYRLMKDFDKNFDGVISKEEMVHVMEVYLKTSRVSIKF